MCRDRIGRLPEERENNLEELLIRSVSHCQSWREQEDRLVRQDSWPVTLSPRRQRVRTRLLGVSSLYAQRMSIALGKMSQLHKIKRLVKLRWLDPIFDIRWLGQGVARFFLSDERQRREALQNT